MSKRLQYPIIACGYRIDFDYLIDFLDYDREEDDEVAALRLSQWYEWDIPYEERRNYPVPSRCVPRDGEPEEIILVLRTRLEVVREASDIEERLHETEVDREKRDRFVESWTKSCHSEKVFDPKFLKFDVKEFRVTARDQ